MPEKDKDRALEEIVKEIVSRGHDVEIRRSKDGMKVFEIVKRLVREIREAEE